VCKLRSLAVPSAEPVNAKLLSLSVETQLMGSEWKRPSALVNLTFATADLGSHTMNVASSATVTIFLPRYVPVNPRFLTDQYDEHYTYHQQ
jgi:hypothetical protein